MAEHPLEHAQAQRLPFVDASILEDRTRPPKPVPMWLGRPYGNRSPSTASQLRGRARGLVRSLSRANPRNRAG